MTKYAVIFLALVLVGVGALFLIEQNGNRLLRQEAYELRQQLAQSQVENQLLKQRFAATTTEHEKEKGELTRLRGQVAALRQTEQENARLKTERDRQAKQTEQASEPEPQQDFFDREYGPGTRVRVHSAKYWGYALINFAANNQGRFPESFDQAAAFLPAELSEEAKAQSLQAVNELEILYHGLRSDLDKLPPESTIIVRERQPWLDQKGRWCKAYGIADGSSFIRPSDKNDFEEWERLRIPKSRLE